MAGASSVAEGSFAPDRGHGCELRHRQVRSAHRAVSQRMDDALFPGEKPGTEAARFAARADAGEVEPGFHMGGRARPPVFALRATTRRESSGAPEAWRRRPGGPRMQYRIYFGGPLGDRALPEYIHCRSAPFRSPYCFRLARARKMPIFAPMIFPRLFFLF